jgi:perosamine synthetase
MPEEIKIPWWIPRIGPVEKKYMEQVLDNNFPNEGKLTTLFEEKISKLLGCKNAVAVPNGTCAMFLSLKALDIGHGDEVIVSDMTFIATANAVEMTGAKPVLVDVDTTLNMDTNKFSEAITENTKAVMPVHVSGRGADMDRIMEIAQKRNIPVVEDAAEGFMSKHKGKYLGTFGKFGCFSFSPHKTITTGQGGLIVTDDDALAVRLRELKDQGRPVRGTGGDDVHDVIGYNFKFTDLQAAVGLGQLTYLSKRLEKMKNTYKTYLDNLEGVDGILVFNFDIDNNEIPQWTDALADRRNELDSHLRSRGIDCRRFWFPLHTQKPYRLSDDNFPNSVELSRKAIWLPSAFTLSDSDVTEVCSTIKEFYG